MLLGKAHIDINPMVNFIDYSLKAQANKGNHKNPNNLFYGKKLLKFIPKMHFEKKYETEQRVSNYAIKFWDNTQHGRSVTCINKL